MSSSEIHPGAPGISSQAYWADSPQDRAVRSTLAWNKRRFAITQLQTNDPKCTRRANTLSFRRSRIPDRFLRRLSRRWLIDLGLLRGMADVIYRLGVNVLRFQRGIRR
jgi:hypothetical protein